MLLNKITCTIDLIFEAKIFDLNMKSYFKIEKTIATAVVALTDTGAPGILQLQSNSALVVTIYDITFTNECQLNNC